MATAWSGIQFETFSFIHGLMSVGGDLRVLPTLNVYLYVYFLHILQLGEVIFVTDILSRDKLEV